MLPLYRLSYCKSPSSPTLPNDTVSDNQQYHKQQWEWTVPELVRICIHWETVYGPNTRQGNQTGKCQTDGLNVGTYLTECTHVFFLGSCLGEAD